jgi:hypothetical protein
MEKREASVLTTTVDVRVLSVGGKQVTLSLFKQIEREDIIDRDTGLLRGTPWGRVNYHVGCQSECPHVHIVWSSDGRLRHAIEFDRFPELEGTLTEIVGDAAAAVVVRKALDDGFKPEKWTDLRFPINFEGRTVRPYLPRDLKAFWGFSWFTDKEAASRAAREKLEAEYPASGESYRASLRNALAELDAYRRNYTAAYTTVAETEQLFIAV